MKFTTWQTFDHSDPVAAIAFLRHEVITEPGVQWGMRPEFRAEVVAAVDIMQAMYDELIVLRAKVAESERLKK